MREFRPYDKDSANVEVVFSGAGSISMKSHCLDPQLLRDCAFMHYNYNLSTSTTGFA